MDRRPNTIRPDKADASTPQARVGAAGLADDLPLMRRHAERNPTYQRILGCLSSLLSGPGADVALLERFERAWQTRSFPIFYERPLLILACLRADALVEAEDHPLYAALAAPAPDPSVVTAETVGAALARDRLGVWSTMTTRRVQTNDTSRAIAWMWPALLAGCDEGKRPLALVDVGAGAGLNLIGDQLPLVWSDQATGKPIACASRINAVARIGFDSRPLSVQRDDDILWMRACIWPGDVDRLQRFDAGVAAMRAASKKTPAPVVERLNASLVPKRLAALAAQTPKDTLLLVYQTLLRGYLEPGDRDTYEREILDLVLQRPAGGMLWAELELDDARRRLPAVLLVHVRARDTVKTLRLGRSSQHPSAIEIDASGVAELSRRVGT
jgi:hypothetical protein